MVRFDPPSKAVLSNGFSPVTLCRRSVARVMAQRHVALHPQYNIGRTPRPVLW